MSDQDIKRMADDIAATRGAVDRLTERMDRFMHGGDDPDNPGVKIRIDRLETRVKSWSGWLALVGAAAASAIGGWIWSVLTGGKP